MAAESVTHIARQQSFKAYVDTLETKVDGLNHTDTTYTAGDFLTLDGTDFYDDSKDADDIASDSARHLATQKSIKTYVDTLEIKVDGLNHTDNPYKAGDFLILLVPCL